MFSGRVFEPVFVAFSIGYARFSDFRFEGQIDQLENLVAVSSCSSWHIYSRDRVTKRHFFRKSWPPRIRGQKLRPGGPEYIKRIFGVSDLGTVVEFLELKRQNFTLVMPFQSISDQKSDWRIPMKSLSPNKIAWIINRFYSALQISWEQNSFKIAYGCI